MLRYIEKKKRARPGSEHYIESHGPMPDHVHKSGGRGGDQVQVGNWVDGTPGPAGTGTVGTWTVTDGSKSVFCDRGKTHASKDFFDPVKQRRILWIWGTVPSGIQAIPRTMTYHPGIKQIVYSPAEEISMLRDRQISTLTAASLKPLTALPIRASAASDIELFFAVPIFNNFSAACRRRTPIVSHLKTHLAETYPMLRSDPT